MQGTHHLVGRGTLRSALALVAVAALLVSQGCSFVASSKSSSKIVSSPFTSSARSSDGGGEAQSAQYQAEAESYSQAFVEAGGGKADSFQRGLSRIAAERGISDWEADPATWVAVGRGLARADVAEDQAGRYAGSWSQGSQDLASLVMQGYQASR